MAEYDTDFYAGLTRWQRISVLAVVSIRVPSWLRRNLKFGTIFDRRTRRSEGAAKASGCQGHIHFAVCVDVTQRLNEYNLQICYSLPVISYVN
jgi:hypothetical protein